MSADKSFHYSVRLDIQRCYGTSQKILEDDVEALKTEFEYLLRSVGRARNNLCTVIWVEEVKPIEAPK
jgi:hypothetical protein